MPLEPAGGVLIALATSVAGRYNPAMRIHITPIESPMPAADEMQLAVGCARCACRLLVGEWVLQPIPGCRLVYDGRDSRFALCPECSKLCLGEK